MANHFKGVQILFEKNPQKGLEFKSWQARLGRRERPPPQTRHWSGPVFPGFTGGFFKRGESSGDEMLGVELPFEPLWNLSEGRDFGDWAWGAVGFPNLWCFSDDIESNLWSIRYLYRPRLWSIGGHMLVYYFCHSKCRFFHEAMKFCQQDFGV